MGLTRRLERGRVAFDFLHHGDGEDSIGHLQQSENPSSTPPYMHKYLPTGIWTLWLTLIWTA